MPPKGAKKKVAIAPSTEDTVIVYSGAASPADSKKPAASDDNNNSSASDIKTTTKRVHISFDVDDGRHPQQLAEEKKHQTDNLIHAREKHEALDTKLQPYAVAFHLEQIPTVLDTSDLSAAHLRAELKARGLSTTGTRQHLVRRLEMYIVEFESHRLKNAVDAEQKIKLKRQPKAAAAAVPKAKSSPSADKKAKAAPASTAAKKKAKKSD